MKRIKENSSLLWKVAGILLPIISYILPFSCTSIDCPIQNTVGTAYTLNKADGTSDTLGVDTMWIWTKRVDGKDTLLLNRLYGSKATGFYLYISYTLPEDTFYLVLADTARALYCDTFRIKKENYPHFESVDCQASYFHTITAVSTTHHIIDSLVINNPNVNYDINTTHFKLYLKARR